MTKEEIVREIATLSEKDKSWVRSRIYRLNPTKERDMLKQCFEEAAILIDKANEITGMDIQKENNYTAAHSMAIIADILYREKYEPRHIANAIGCLPASIWRMRKRVEDMKICPISFKKEMDIKKKLEEYYYGK